MGAIVYLNGKMVDKENACINIYDHAFLYGDGVFEGIRFYNYIPFKLKEHIDRLYESAHSIWLEIPMGKDQMYKTIMDTIKASELKDGYIRAIVTRGVGNLGLDPRKCFNPQVIIIVDLIQLYPQELYEKGLEIVTASTIRTPASSLNPRIKSLNYLNNILAKIESIQSGAIEALMLNHNGEVTECSADNIFAVKHNIIMTPPLHAGILGGITRSVVIELAKKSGYQVLESTMTRHDLYVADEVFLTGSAVEMIPVVKIDGRHIGEGKPGPVFKKLKNLFKELVSNLKL